jgi:hypothetical protein
VVDIATSYGLNGPGFESWCGRDFPHPSRSAVGSPHPPLECVRLITGGKADGEKPILCHVAPSLNK